MQAPPGAATAIRPLVLIPSYNSGARIFSTVADARRFWPDVWVVVDGSTDGTNAELAAMADAATRILIREQNGGKGAAVFDGLCAAEAAGFTHVLVMDADGQHPAEAIPAFMAMAAQYPADMILGVPVFDASAPRVRVLGRRISNALARLQTLRPVGDSLFGFRVYPLAPLLAVMRGTSTMRRFDFDPEALVRLSWAGLAAHKLPAQVRYFTKAQGGVSHFRYGRDNLRLAAMHLRLLAGAVRRLPKWRRDARQGSSFCEQKETKKLY